MSHVTMHLWRVNYSRAPLAVLRMATDRIRLRHTDGLSFYKLLGTGDGRTFSPADADVRTWGLLCVWASREQADAFEGHRTPRGWRRIAVEEWRADLGCIQSKGRWSGRTPFTRQQHLRGWDGPVASITRARLRPSSLRTFYRAVPPVVADLHDGPLLRVGIGEAPVGVQGTFTVWPDTTTMVDFAYGRAAHRQVIADTERLGWYAEELFARFAVLAMRGTVFGAEVPRTGSPRTTPPEAADQGQLGA
jgi:hypothetical protein